MRSGLPAQVGGFFVQHSRQLAARGRQAGTFGRLQETRRIGQLKRIKLRSDIPIIRDQLRVQLDTTMPRWHLVCLGGNRHVTGWHHAATGQQARQRGDQQEVYDEGPHARILPREAQKWVSSSVAAHCFEIGTFAEPLKSFTVPRFGNEGATGSAEPPPLCETHCAGILPLTSPT